MEPDTRFESLQAALMKEMREAGSDSLAEWEQVSEELAALDQATYDPAIIHELEKLAESLPATAGDGEAELLHLIDLDGDLDDVTSEASPRSGGRRGQGLAKLFKKMAERRKSRQGRETAAGAGGGDARLVDRRRSKIKSTLKEAWRDAGRGDRSGSRPKVLVLADDDGGETVAAAKGKEASATLASDES